MHFLNDLPCWCSSKLVFMALETVVTYSAVFLPESVAFSPMTAKFLSWFSIVSLVWLLIGTFIEQMPFTFEYPDKHWQMQALFNWIHCASFFLQSCVCQTSNPLSCIKSTTDFKENPHLFRFFTSSDAVLKQTFLVILSAEYLFVRTMMM